MKDDDPTALPLPPPFAIGTWVRYDGIRRIYHDIKQNLPILAPGMVVKIIRVEPGRQGTGRIIALPDGDEVVDRTRHGRSVYSTSRGSQRTIWADYQSNNDGSCSDVWTIVDPPKTDTRHRNNDVVIDGASFFGLVFAAGEKRFSVVWESGQVTRHAQGYRGFRLADERSWNGDPDYERRVRAWLDDELRGVNTDRGIRSHGTKPLRSKTRGQT